MKTDTMKLNDGPAPVAGVVSSDLLGSFFQALRADPLVYRILRTENGSFEDCILALCNDRRRLQKRIEQLENIAPKKLRLPDGSVRVWHCPDDLVPEIPSA